MKPSPELQAVAKRAAKLLGLPECPRFEVKKCRRGRAHTREGYFTIPLWAATAHFAYAVHYIVHELTHFTPNMGYGNAGPFKGWFLRSHGQGFRIKEAEACERFGLRLVYRGTAYIHEIRDIATGQTICDQGGNPAPRFDVGL